MIVDPGRLEVARVAQHLASGYYAFLVAHLVAVNPMSINSLPPSPVLGTNPTGEIRRKDGTFHTLDLRFYLDLLREDQSLQSHFLRTWAMGALLMLGDELGAHDYFDHAPILELVYHLRNGVAHGNRFNITYSGKRRLARHDAHNRQAAVKSRKRLAAAVVDGCRDRHQSDVHHFRSDGHHFVRANTESRQP
ncbi:hypothetical protein AB4Y40_17140 [Paraburkholderia sp. EG287B]|uniref:hypothetical protein n=1 Tax=Paraburkholderia sp. EG287B TaxID=3237010 RepID=UPI0034D1BE5B